MKSTVFSIVVLVLVVAVTGCKGPFVESVTPVEMAMHPGPGVDGPGPGVIMQQLPMTAGNRTSQVSFVGPQAMRVAWDVSAPGQFDSEPKFCPFVYNFSQNAIYRLKLTAIPNRPGVELYPTLEIGPAVPRTEAFLSHNPIPIQLTEEDFDQVLSGNFVTKVIYLPDPDFQELALAGVETLVSTRLDPGLDPIVEADRRGAILAILRIGRIDLEVPGSQGNEGVFQASYADPITTGGSGIPMGTQVGGGGRIPTTYISGVNAPQWGIPITATPIGLPGPPHIPLGSPAGLRKHVIANHTKVHMPSPTKHIRMDVRQIPGYRFPKPKNHSRIVQLRPHMGACAGPACPTGAAYSECADGQCQ